MEARLNRGCWAPAGYKALVGLETYLHGCGLEPKLQHMVKLRASQVNGCAYCIDMHWKGPAGARGDRAAPLRPGRVAGEPVLHRSGAGGDGMDRGRNPHH